MHGCGNHIIARLSQIYMVVRMNILSTPPLAPQLHGPISDDLIHVHMSGSSRPSLKHVDNKMLFEFAFHHLPGCFLNLAGKGRLQETQLGIRFGGSIFDQSQRLDESRRKTGETRVQR